MNLERTKQYARTVVRTVKMDGYYQFAESQLDALIDLAFRCGELHDACAGNPAQEAIADALLGMDVHALNTGKEVPDETVNSR